MKNNAAVEPDGALGLEGAPVTLDDHLAGITAIEILGDDGADAVFGVAAQRPKVNILARNIRLIGRNPSFAEPMARYLRAPTRALTRYRRDGVWEGCLPGLRRLGLPGAHMEPSAAPSAGEAEGNDARSTVIGRV